MTIATLTAELLANAPLTRSPAPFRLLEVRGADAGEFLHRLCTQDVKGLADGQVKPAAFLDAKGKLLVTCLVGRLGTSFWLEVQAEQEERLAALLERYHFSEKLTIGRGPAGVCAESVRRGEAVDTTGRMAMAGPQLTIHYERRGLAFERRHAAGGEFTGAPLTAEMAECLRMIAGLVRVGVETEPSTLALEADLDDHCSTTKGCYTGQEIVARIHTYGHVNRKLCRLELAAGAPITSPVPLHDDDDLPVGRVMHAVPVPGHELRLGLGYLPKDFQAPGTVLKLPDGGRVIVLD